MNDFLTFINERYINVFDSESKMPYVDQVWEILQKSYESIGGLKGSGFNSKEDMINNIPMWKIAHINKKIVAVILYKDKEGRKSVAIGTDGSEIGKKKAIDIITSDLKRSYGEKSKANLGLLLKQYPENIIEPFIVSIQDVKKILKTDDIKEVRKLKDSEIPIDGRMTISKYPFIKKYAYLRKIGNDYIFKVMIGTPSLKIKRY